VSEPTFPELGFYTLAGAPKSTRAVVDEVRTADEMGLGFAFISERLNVKEAATVSGAAGAVSERIRIATAATNHNTRHPQITAAYASTMQSLTGGRFTLGLGRGFDRMFDAMGLPHITNAQLEDFAGVMRRLFAGEMILGHDGPAGKWPYLNLSDVENLHVDLGFVAIGPKSLALGGKVFDQVVLHTFFSDEYTAKAVKIVKDSAEQAGRDPDAVKVWSCFATVGDHIPYDLRIKKTVGRLVTYMQGYGQLLVEVNGWDMADLDRLRNDEMFATFQGAIDGVATTEQLEHFATLVPREWLAPMAAGSPEQCVAAIRKQFDLGCDGVIMHGANPTELAPIVEQYAKG
jgi:probable F420-dependent oxidoreductase